MADQELTVTLSRTESILAVVPEYFSCPSWSNQLISVHIINNADNSVRTVSFQPHEQSRDQQVLFRLCADAHAAMLSTITTKETA